MQDVMLSTIRRFTCCSCYCSRCCCDVDCAWHLFARASPPRVNNVATPRSYSPQGLFFHRQDHSSTLEYAPRRFFHTTPRITAVRSLGFRGWFSAGALTETGLPVFSCHDHLIDRLIFRFSLAVLPWLE